LELALPFAATSTVQKCARFGTGALTCHASKSVLRKQHKLLVNCGAHALLVTSTMLCDYINRLRVGSALAHSQPLVVLHAILDASFKTDDYKIKGCQSSVWIHSYCKDGLVHFEGDSDAMIVKGLVSLMIQVLSGQKPAEIVQAPLSFIQTTGLSSHLAQTRSNGLRAMIKQMKLDASVYGASSSQ
jgi:cysteine desulfuration protein SufE